MKTTLKLFHKRMIPTKGLVAEVVAKGDYTRKPGQTKEDESYLFIDVGKPGEYYCVAFYS